MPDRKQTLFCVILNVSETVLPDPGDFDESSYDEAIDAAQSAVTDAEDVLTDARESYGEAEEEASHRTVTSPASGVVLSLRICEVCMMIT